jgi:hypothetical protein
MDEAKRPEGEPELARPDEAIEDLEPDEQEVNEVTGGTAWQPGKVIIDLG